MVAVGVLIGDRGVEPPVVGRDRVVAEMRLLTVQPQEKLLAPHRAQPVPGQMVGSRLDAQLLRAPGLRPDLRELELVESLTEAEVLTDQSVADERRRAEAG